MSDPSPAEIMDVYGVEEPAPRRLVKDRRRDWVEDIDPSTPDMWDRFEGDGTGYVEAECSNLCGAALFVPADSTSDHFCDRCREVDEFL